MEKAINKKYVKGFNHAYLLAKYKPELIKSITATKSQNNYIQGLKDGKDTFEQQKVKSRLQDLQNLELRKDRNRDLDLER